MGVIVAQPIESLLFDVLWLYILFIILFLAGYFMAFWRKKEDKIALAVSKSYMNNALAIGLAFAFFDPRITILMVLSEIPWNTTLGLFKLLLLLDVITFRI